MLCTEIYSGTVLLKVIWNGQQLLTSIPIKHGYMGPMWARSGLSHTSLQYGTHIGPIFKIRIQVFYILKNTFKSKNRHRLCKNIHMLLKTVHNQHILLICIGEYFLFPPIRDPYRIYIRLKFRSFILLYKYFKKQKLASLSLCGCLESIFCNVNIP